MNFEEIQTFLMVCQCGSIAKASTELFISQGTASTRIQHLEELLGIPLLYRQKGVRSLSLTPEGYAFLPIAQQWSALYRDALHIKNTQIYRELRIAALDMINTYIFVDIYKQFLSTHKNIILTIQTEHSTEIHQLIENQQMDIGFAFSLHMFPNVVAKPLYQEDMVILYNKNAKFAKNKDIHGLDIKNEIYLRWSNEFNLWHNQQFPYTSEKRITLGTVSMVEKFMDSVETWVILSKSIASIFIQNHSELTYCEIDQAPPKRTAYVLCHKYPKSGVKETMNHFLEYVIASIKENKNITPLIDFPTLE